MSEKTPTEQIAEILGVEFLPLLDPSDVRELQKALPGYQAVADDAARFCQNHAEALRLDEVRDSLEQGLTDIVGIYESGTKEGYVHHDRDIYSL